MMMRMEAAALAADARLERMDRVGVLYAEITAASREFLRVLAESDRLGDWAEEGFASCADWLAWRVGITRHTASEKVRVARALESLPQISEAMAKGELFVQQGARAHARGDRGERSRAARVRARGVGRQRRAARGGLEDARPCRRGERRAPSSPRAAALDLPRRRGDVRRTWARDAGGRSGAHEGDRSGR